MIKIYLSDLMGKHKLKIQDIADKTGLSRTTISNMYHEKITAISFDTITKLCQLFNCEIQDLIEYIPDEEKSSQD